MTTREEAARAAFESDNVDASREVHQNLVAAKEKHVGGPGEFIESIVFGGLDGSELYVDFDGSNWGLNSPVVTTFAIIVAAAAADLNRGSILILGFANLLGDAVGMALGDYISSKAEADQEDRERKREEWELENVPEMEKAEMVEIYMNKGLPREDAQEVVDLLFTSQKAFLDVMLIQELGIMSEEEGGSPLKVSFFIFGGAPMLPYLFSIHYTVAGGLDGVFGASIAVFAVALFALGATRGKITGKRWWLSGITMLINGGITTAASYFIGYGISKATQ
ncbi:hypothetical protein PROFUN_03916 [Planoprotostelium fungivorum]|uniref:Integral membrane protein n=1 Tax=Planoprotostelium fungivorum TaxID=1890364 RepID=A0A2P6MTP0_9EUKA|nr:hypothetical protein PROFUN_03916 [Planoprotostelium fungivorum]